MTPGASTLKTRSFLSQHCLEKLHHIGVESFMERRAVEVRQAVADFRRLPRQARIAGWQEVIVACAGDHVIFGRSGQVGAYRLVIVGMWLMAIVGCSPELDRGVHAA